MHTPQFRIRSAAGFTLLEIVVVVAIIGLMAAIAIPAYGKLQKRSVNTLMSNELRIASGALELYVFEKGSWPPDGAGGWPAELSGYLPPPDRWNQSTPIGGTWAWARNTEELSASLRINNTTVSSEQIADLDQMMDDGSLAAGNLLTFGASLVYVLER